MRNLVVAKAVVVNGAGEVLMLRRSATDTRRPGQWDFPGGGIEQGEDLIAGVAREVREEAGLSIAQSSFTLVYAATEPWKPKNESVTRLLFVAHLDAAANVELSFEHDEYKWVGASAALRSFTQPPFYAAGLAYAADHGLLAV